MDKLFFCWRHKQKVPMFCRSISTLKTISRVSNTQYFLQGHSWDTLVYFKNWFLKETLYSGDAFRKVSFFVTNTSKSLWVCSCLCECVSVWWSPDMRPAQNGEGDADTQSTNYCQMSGLKKTQRWKERAVICSGENVILCLPALRRALEEKKSEGENQKKCGNILVPIRCFGTISINP